VFLPKSNIWPRQIFVLATLLLELQIAEVYTDRTIQISDQDFADFCVSDGIMDIDFGFGSDPDRIFAEFLQ